MVEQTKVCAMCERALPLSAFHRQSTGKLGVTARCGPCLGVYFAEYHAKNRERRRLQRLARIEADCVGMRLKRFNANHGSAITPDDLLSMYRGQGGLCALTEVPLGPFEETKFHIDHIIPISRGGPTTIDNLQLLSPLMNRIKTNLTNDELFWTAHHLSTLHSHIVGTPPPEFAQVATCQSL